MDATLIQRISAELRAPEQPSRNESLSRNYRRRRKDINGDLLLPSTLGSIQRSALIFVCVVASIGAFSVPTISSRRSLPATPLHHTSPFSGRAVPSRITWSTSTLFSSNNNQDIGSSDDEDEWRAMLAAFQMYKAAYGNLKVPLRFVVPALAPWPGL